jgi:hypothetical protein
MIFIEKFGYILSEIPVLFFVIWFAIRWVQQRRRRKHQPLYNEQDRRMILRNSEYGPRDWEFYPRFFLAVVAVTFIGTLEFIIFASFGAAILATTFLLTSTMIVRQLFF